MVVADNFAKQVYKTSMGDFEIVKGSSRFGGNSEYLPKCITVPIQFYQISMFPNERGMRAVRSIILKQQNDNGVCTAGFKVEKLDNYELSPQEVEIFKKKINEKKSKYIKYKEYVNTDILPNPTSEELMIFTSQLLN
jgi:hypothetical protein